MLSLRLTARYRLADALKPRYGSSRIAASTPARSGRAFDELNSTPYVMPLAGFRIQKRSTLELPAAGRDLPTVYSIRKEINVSL